MMLPPAPSRKPHDPIRREFRCGAVACVAMERRPLGRSGIEVGRIGLGCMPMDWGYFGASEDDPTDVIGRALELGIDHLDTSDVYGPFTNEETVGRALEGRRDEAVIATKVGLVVGPNGGYPLSKVGRPE